MPKTRVKFGYVWTKQRQAIAVSYWSRHCIWRLMRGKSRWSNQMVRDYENWVREFLRPEHEAKATQRRRAAKYAHQDGAKLQTEAQQVVHGRHTHHA